VALKSGLRYEYIGMRGVDWIDLAQEKDMLWGFVNAVMNLRVPQNVGKLPISCTTGSFSRRAQFHGVSWFKYSCICCMGLSTTRKPTSCAATR
jgi:hypothetical protein